MALISCNECSNEVSDNATKCPHCGARLKSSLITKSIKFLFGAIFVFLIAVLVVNSCVPKYEMDALENRRVCQEVLAGGNRLSSTWQKCQHIYNEAISKGKIESSTKNTQK